MLATAGTSPVLPCCKRVPAHRNRAHIRRAKPRSVQPNPVISTLVAHCNRGSSVDVGSTHLDPAYVADEACTELDLESNEVAPASNDASPEDPWLEHVAGAYSELWGPKRMVDTRQPPLFLHQYPVPDGKEYTHNSFLGKKDPHGGKFYVPPEKQQQFCEEYLAHWLTPNTRSLYLTENYHDGPRRYFQELDFDFDLDHGLVEELSMAVVHIINQTVREFFALPSPPQMFASTRTPNKIHLVYPEVVTTDYWTRACRERLLQRCQRKFGAVVGDWGRVIDSPHGSLRMLGSLKPRRLVKDPEWVREWMYKPCRCTDGGWAQVKLTSYVLLRSSILPDRQQHDLFQQLYPDWRAQLADKEAPEGPVMRVYTGPRGDSLRVLPRSSVKLPKVAKPRKMVPVTIRLVS
jgi:hypothetical protein